RQLRLERGQSRAVGVTNRFELLAKPLQLVAQLLRRGLLSLRRWFNRRDRRLRGRGNRQQRKGARTRNHAGAAYTLQGDVHGPSSLEASNRIRADRVGVRPVSYLGSGET